MVPFGLEYFFKYSGVPTTTIFATALIRFLESRDIRVDRTVCHL